MAIIVTVVVVSAFWVIIGIVVPFCLPVSPSRGCVKRRVFVTYVRVFKLRPMLYTRPVKMRIIAYHGDLLKTRLIRRY